MPTVVSSNGTTAGVTSSERLMTQSVTRAEGLDVCLNDKLAWCFQDDAVTPTGAADVFCRISNTQATPLVITKIVAEAASAELISVQTTANYTSATSHTDKTANPRYAGSAVLYTSYGAFESDVDITGDSGSVEVARLACGVAADQRELDLTGGNEIIIPNGYSLLLEAVTGAVALSYSVFGHHASRPVVSS